MLMPITACRVVMLNVEDVILTRSVIAAPAGDHHATGTTTAFSPNSLVVSKAFVRGAGRMHGPAERWTGATDAPSAMSEQDPGRRVRLTAHVERRRWLLTVRRLAGVPVEFQSNGRLLGTAVTDEQGRATLSHEFGSGNRGYSARVVYDNIEFTSDGGVFVWPTDHPVIVIDLDETLVMSRYVDIVLRRQDPSQPMPNARKAVRCLAQQFGIIYLSSRARLFRNMTQNWLRRHGFPPGPILHTRDIFAIFHQRKAKTRMVQELKKRGVHVVAGIGDKAGDEQAFSDNNVLPIIIAKLYFPRNQETIVVPDWSRIPEILQRQQRAERRSELAQVRQP